MLIGRQFLLTFGELGVACVYTYQSYVPVVLVIALHSTLRSFRLESLADIGSMKMIGTLSLALGMATDVVIAAALCYFLRDLRTGHSKSVSYSPAYVAVHC